MDADLAGRLHKYVDALFVDEDEALRFVRQQTAAQGLPQISLQPYEGRLMQLLVMLSGARRVVEIGTLAGYSAIWIARGLPEGGRLITIEKSSTHADLARAHIERAQLADRVTVVQGDGLQSLQRLQRQAPFDMLFIDADKVSYPRYLDWAAVHLRAGGALLAHNAFWGGRIFAPETADDLGLVEFNQALAQHPAFAATIIEVGDGLALGIKRGG